MKIADFRTQSTAPDAPGAGVVGVYADASGVLIKKNSAGTTITVGADYKTTYLSAAVSTGKFSQTGICFGSLTANNTGLAQPALWLQVDVSGTKYAVPAYSLR